MVLNKSGATPTNLYGDCKTLSLWGIWFPMLFDRLSQYAKGLEGFPVPWPMPKTDLGYLDAFYVYTSQWDDAASQWDVIPDTWNWGLINDPVLAELIRGLYFQDEATRLATYSDIQERVGTVTYPSFFISQELEGRVHNKKWSVGWYWGGFDFAEVSTGPSPEAESEDAAISGFPTMALFLFSVISIFTIGYIIKRKKKLG